MFIMAESKDTVILTTREASILAENLMRQSAPGRSLANRVATLERDARTAARLITAMLRQVHPSDVFHLPPEA
jgi:hypothetical protein